MDPDLDQIELSSASISKKPFNLGIATKPLSEGFDISPPNYYSAFSFSPSHWNPRNTLMVDYNCRIQSFTNWPKQIRQSPEQLAQSGFYYRSEGDFVHCFYCGVAIHNWEVCDNVHFEHRRHSPQCKFLNMICAY